MVLIAVAALAAPVTLAQAEPARSPVEVVTGTGVVTSESPIVSDVGITVLRAGGNAMDAVVAAAFARGVANPESCGIGGGGFLVYRAADGTVDTLDFFERAPGKGATYTIRRGRGEPGSVHYLHDKGRGNVGVPGFVRGMEAALARYGTTSLADAVAPAVQLAKSGIPVSPQTARAIAFNFRAARELREHSDTYELYYDAPADPVQDRTPKQQGQKLVLADYAATLERIGLHGSAEFYDVAGGYRTATQLLDSMHADGGDPSDWNDQDLQTYEAHWRAPVTAKYRDYQVHSMGGPSAGGTLIAETLNILEGFDLANLPTVQRLHVLAEAQRIAWTDRNAYYGDPGPPGTPHDPDDVWADIPAGLTSEKYAETRRAEIATGPTARRVDAYPPGTFAGHTPWGTSTSTDRGTAGLSVVDAAGNVATITCSLGNAFGSAVTPRGLGFLLNHSSGPWDPAGAPNAAAPGKSPRSQQTPTIIVQRGRPVLAVSGQGGGAIPMGILNAVVQIVDLGRSVEHAVDAARLDCCGHHGGNPNKDVVAEYRPDNTADLLALRTTHGHEVTGEAQYIPYPVLSSATGRRTGPRQSASDPRGECGPSSTEAGVTLSACYQAARAGWLRNHWEPTNRPTR